MVENLVSVVTFLNAFPKTQGRTLELYGDEATKQFLGKVVSELDKFSIKTNKLVSSLPEISTD